MYVPVVHLYRTWVKCTHILRLLLLLQIKYDLFYTSYIDPDCFFNEVSIN